MAPATIGTMAAASARPTAAIATADANDPRPRRPSIDQRKSSRVEPSIGSAPAMSRTPRPTTMQPSPDAEPDSRTAARAVSKSCVMRRRALRCARMSS